MMPIQCRMVDCGMDEMQPGDMKFVDGGPEGKVLLVMLPDGSGFVLDAKTRSIWMITGEPPNITVCPSINARPTNSSKGWHGYLQNGILSDDLEGRKYDA